MKTINKALAAGIALVLIVLVLFLALNATVPAFSAYAWRLACPGRHADAASRRGDPAQADRGAHLAQCHGQHPGERAIERRARRGRPDRRSDDERPEKEPDHGQRQPAGRYRRPGGRVSGGTFSPSKVDIYKVPDGTYIVINGLFPVCVKPADPKASAALDEMSPQSLLKMLTSSDVARGKLVGEETLNGTAVKHYVINGDAFLAAAKKSKDPKTKAFGDALWSAEDADLYVDAKGGYPVAFSGCYSGTYAPLKFEGDFCVDIELTGVNKNTAVNLPSSCNNPISK